MTRSEQLYLDRLRAIRAPKRASIGIGGGSAAGAAAGAPITADQGPLPDGGNLGQSSMPNMQSGVVPGRNRMSIGNSARGNIDLGSFLSARPNQDAINQLAQNPLAQVDPYKATTGVGGFFRRLLGDDANERNEMAAGQRGQMLAKKLLMDQQTQGQMGVLDKQHQYAMERVKAQIEADNTRQATADQTALQRVRLQDQNNLGLEGMRAVNDLIGKSQDQSFRAQQGALERDVTMRGQDINADVAQLHYGQTKDVMPPGWGRIEGQTLYPDPITGEMKVFTGVMPAQGGLDPRAIAEVKRKHDIAAAEDVAASNLAPQTAIRGLGSMLSDAPGAVTSAAAGAVMGSPVTRNMVAPVMAGVGTALNPLLNYLRNYGADERRKKAEEAKRRLQELGATNSPVLNIR